MNCVTYINSDNVEKIKHEISAGVISIFMPGVLVVGLGTWEDMTGVFPPGDGCVNAPRPDWCQGFHQGSPRPARHAGGLHPRCSGCTDSC